MTALELAYQEGVKLAMQEVGLLKEAFGYRSGAALGAALGGGAGALTSPEEATTGETIRRALGGAMAGGAVGGLGGALLRRQGVLGGGIDAVGSLTGNIADRVAPMNSGNMRVWYPCSGSF